MQVMGIWPPYSDGTTVNSVDVDPRGKLVRLTDMRTFLFAPPQHSDPALGCDRRRLLHGEGLQLPVCREVRSVSVYDRTQLIRGEREIL